MSRPVAHEPIAVKIGAVARMIDSSPTTVRRLVKKGVLPAPFRLAPGCEPMWWLSDIKRAVAERAGRPLAA